MVDFVGLLADAARAGGSDDAMVHRRDGDCGVTGMFSRRSQETMAKENPVLKLNDLYKEFMSGKIDRRAFMIRAGALGLSGFTMTQLAKTVPASAQEATPSAAVYPGGYKSMTFEEFRASLAETYPFTGTPGEVLGGQIIMGEVASSNMTTFNPHFADNSPTQPVILQVFETLFGTDPRDGQYVPLLANRWEIAEDGRTYTFYLNEGVTFHDGTPLTTADVVLSFDAQGDETLGSSYTSTFNSAVESYRAIDDMTFEVVATDVLAQVVLFGNIFAPIVPAHIWADVPFDQWQTDGGSTGQDPARVVGTGYLKFVETNEGEGTSTFAKNENYWWANDVPRADEFIFATWPDDTAAIEALRAGAFDFYENVPPSDVESLQAEESIDVALYDTYSFSWYGYQLDPEKYANFTDVKVRQALFYAVDRQSMVDNIMLGYAEVANGTQPILSPAYAPDRIDTVYNFDPEKAAALLDEAGWTLNGDGLREKDGETLTFEIMYGAGSATTDQIAVALQDYWKAIGVTGNPTPVDFDTVLVPALVENYEFQMVLLGFNWDPTGDQSAMFATSSYGGGFNAMRYSNPAYDEAAAASGVELDPEARVELLINATNIVNEDLPIGCLWFRKDRTAFSTRMQNFTPLGGSLLWSIPYVSIVE